jgi:hypothetical protein
MMPPTLSPPPRTPKPLTVVPAHDVKVRPHEGCPLLITWQRLLGVILLDDHPCALLEHVTDADAAHGAAAHCCCGVW